MEETDNLVENEIIRVKLFCNGQRFINGISSSYEIKYSPVLVGVVSEEDIHDIIGRLNDTIQSYWPCNTCYVFGFVCSPFTLGTSLLCPGYCISQSDERAQAMLLNVSLRAKFFDRKITFRIVKHCCSSFVEISFPASLKQGSVGDCENNSSRRSDTTIATPSVFSVVAPAMRSKDL